MKYLNEFNFFKRKPKYSFKVGDYVYLKTALASDMGEIVKLLDEDIGGNYYLIKVINGGKIQNFQFREDETDGKLSTEDEIRFKDSIEELEMRQVASKYNL